MDRHVNQLQRTIAAWQDVFGGGTFMFLLVRRLAWSQPWNAAEVLDALFRAIAFGLVAFAFAGVAGLACVRVWPSIRRVQNELKTRVGDWQSARERRRREAMPTPVPSSSELQRQRREQQQREADAQKQEEDQQRRRELKLQAELEMEFAADQKRRKTLQEFIDTYVDDSLPVDVYEQRLATITDAALRNAPAKAKRYRTVQEIIVEFDRQIDDVDQSTQSEFEKESLRALILMERQNAIQRFMQS